MEHGNSHKRINTTQTHTRTYTLIHINTHTHTQTPTHRNTHTYTIFWLYRRLGVHRYDRIFSQIMYSFMMWFSLPDPRPAGALHVVPPFLETFLSNSSFILSLPLPLRCSYLTPSLSLAVALSPSLYCSLSLSIALSHSLRAFICMTLTYNDTIIIIINSRVY